MLLSYKKHHILFLLLFALLPFAAQAQYYATKLYGADYGIEGEAYELSVGADSPLVGMSIGDAEAEMIEAQVLTTSPLSGRLIRDIEFPEGVLVGAVMKGDKVVKPTGDLRIDAGDVIALFAMASDVAEVERLLQVSIDFF